MLFNKKNIIILITHKRLLLCYLKTAKNHNNQPLNPLIAVTVRYPCKYYVNILLLRFDVLCGNL